MRLVVGSPKRAMDCPFAGISATTPKLSWKCSLFGGRCKLDLPEHFTECPHLADIKDIKLILGGQVK